MLRQSRARAPRVRVRQISDLRLESRLWNRSELERERNGILRQTLRRAFDEGSAREVGPFHIGRDRDDKDRLKNSGESVALPDDNRPATGLLKGTIRPEVRPPDLAAPQLRSSSSSFSAQSARPCSANARSSSGLIARRSRFHRFGSARRTTIRLTHSPGRSGNGSDGLRKPFSYRASRRRMWLMLYHEYVGDGLYQDERPMRSRFSGGWHDFCCRERGRCFPPATSPLPGRSRPASTTS